MVYLLLTSQRTLENRGLEHIPTVELLLDLCHSLCKGLDLLRCSGVPRVRQANEPRGRRGRAWRLPWQVDAGSGGRALRGAARGGPSRQTSAERYRRRQHEQYPADRGEAAAGGSARHPLRDEIVPGPLLVLRVFLQCAFVRAYNSMLSTFRTLAHLLLLSASVAAFPVQSAIGSASPPLHVRSSVCSLQVSDARARGCASCNFAHVCARFACISINMWHFNGNVEIASRGEYAWPCLQAHAGAAQLGRRGFLLAAGIFFSPFRFCIRQADILIVYYICVNSSLTNVEQS